MRGMIRDRRLDGVAKIRFGGEHFLHFASEFGISLADTVQECLTVAWREIQGTLDHLCDLLPSVAGHSTLS